MGKIWPICAIWMAVASAAATGAGMMTVAQRGRAFAMSDVEVGSGDTIRFKNEDGFLHQIFVQAPRLAFESGEEAPGESVDIRFPNSGLFEVRCHIHPKMLLRVNVR